MKVKLYSMDLGNGFSKRVIKDECITEASVFAQIEDVHTTDETITKLSTPTNKSFVVGDDVRTLGLEADSALGNIDRYETKEFENLLLGFIAKDFKQDVIIENFITGLPVNHWEVMKDYMKRMLEGKHIVIINEDEEIVIEIRKCHVLHQPLGTYYYAIATSQIKPNEQHTLVVDCGHGTLDITEMRGHTITKQTGNSKGAKTAFLDVYNYLSTKYDGHKYLTIANIPDILQHGLKYNGSLVNVLGDRNVQNILMKHFASIFKFLKENNFELKSYDNVIFTGGITHLYESYFEQVIQPNYVIIKEGQACNVKGYNAYGKVVTE